MKFFIFFLILISISLLFADGVQPVGLGTETEPYQIATLDNLLWVSTNSSSWDKYFSQTADIDASDTQNWNGGEGWSPIGNSTVKFSGNYNGQKNSIDGLYINRPTFDNVGLMGNINSHAIILNVRVMNAYICGNNNVGAICGLSNSGNEIRKCASSGDIISNHNAVGGIVGKATNNTTITECYSSCNIQGTYYYAGGLVGELTISTIENCFSNNQVYGYCYVGGFVGLNEYSTIENCYSKSNIFGSAYIGGFAGKHTDTSEILNSFWDEELSDQSWGIGNGTSDGVNGKTTAEMQNIATFTDISTVGLDSPWDFVGNPNDDTGNDDFWNIDGTTNDGYPFLSWQQPTSTLSADFSANLTSIFTWDQVDFTDISAGNPTSWEWDFEDDGTIDSYVQNPSFYYTEPGTYTVSLTISDGTNTDTETKVDYIYVEQLYVPAEAEFIADQTTVSLGAAIQFTDQSFGPPDTWAWDFDNDGTVDSNEQNPQYTYTSPGVYTVSLTVENMNGPDTETKVDYITVSGNKVLSLNHSYVNVGNSSSLKPTEEITLEAWIKPDAYANSGWGGAGFIMGDGRDCCSNSGGVGLHITGSDLTDQAIRGYVYTPGSLSNGALKSVGSWGIVTEQWQHVAMVFQDTLLSIFLNGVQVNQVTFISSQINTNSVNFCIGATGYLQSMYSFHGKMDEVRVWNVARTEEQIQANMFLSLNGDETGLVGYWNFDDGTYNDITTNGNNGSPSGTVSIVDDEIILNLNADFEAAPTTVNLGTEIQFTDLSTGIPTSWEWDFDNDGTIDSYEQNPAYTYPNPGTYTVSLTVSDGRSSQNFRMSASLRNVEGKEKKDSDRTTSTETKENYITVTGAQLTINPSSLEFGNVVVNDFSSINIELTNTGTEDIVIDSTFTVIPFTVSSNYNTTLTPTQTLTFPVTFQPTATLFYDEELIIATNIDTFYVDLTGTGVTPTPAWNFSWTSHNFGQTDIDTGTSTNLVITNTGNIDLIVSDCNISESHFDVSETSFIIESGNSKNITVSFNPEDILSYNGVISYTSEAGTQELNVSGNGYYQSAAPVLEYVSETRFNGTAGVEPEIGAPGTYFEYRISYTDTDNDAPMAGFPQVGIDKNGDHDFLEPDEFMMPLTEIDPTDTNYADGKEYSFITQLPEDAVLGYAFIAYDVLGNPAIGQGTNYETGPTVTDDYLDLSIYANDITFSKGNPDVGDEVVITAVIHNYSDYPANVIPIKIYEEDILLKETTISYLGAQSQTSISLEHIFTVPEYYPIKVVIDEGDVIEEANELNNFAIRAIVAGDYIVPGAITATSYLNSSSAYSGGTLRFYGSAEYVNTRFRSSVVSGALVELTISGNGQSWTYTGYTDASGNYNIYFTAPQNLGSYTATAEITDFTFTTQTSIHNFSVVSPPPAGYPPTEPELPDLKLISCSMTGSPIINNSMEISGSFSNTGEIPAEDVKFYLYLDNVLSDSIFVDFLAVNGSEDFSFNHTWTSVENHTVLVIVDPLNTVSESVEYNNSKSVTRYIYPEHSDLTPTDILFDDQSPLTNQEITITGVIQNLNYEASDVTTVEIYDVFSRSRAETLLGTLDLDPITNGATQNIYFDHTFTEAGLHQIKLVVDPDELITESDETNQTLFSTIDVEVPTAELTISAINVSNTNPNVGGSNKLLCNDF